MIFDYSHEVIVSMACRDYGSGRIFINTDRIGGNYTGHGDNAVKFWRRILEWTSKKFPNELIKVGLVISSNPDSIDKINKLVPVTIKKLSVPDLATKDLSVYDCLYFTGLPSLVSSKVTLKIKTFVDNGGGLIIENPDRAQETINVLRSIEGIYCYSNQRLIDKSSYWTIDGGSHYVYQEGVTVEFMSTFRQSDFSNYWTILMSNVPNAVTISTTTLMTQELDFDQSNGSEFGISYFSSMQNGIVTLQTGFASSTSSSSSSSSSTSSSSVDSQSSSSEYDQWNLCDNIVAEWKMNDASDSSIVSESKNNFSHYGFFKTGLNSDASTFSKHVTGKLNGALLLAASLGDRIETPINTSLNFTDGLNDLPFSVSFWINPSSLGLNTTLLIKDTDGVKLGWSVTSLSNYDIHFRLYGSNDIVSYRGRSAPINTLISNRWQHIVISYNGIGTSNPENGVSIYVDGRRVDNSTISNGLAYVRLNNPYSSFRMSSYVGGYNGYMDQVVIFDKALSNREVEALYNRGNGTENCHGDIWNTSSSSISSCSSDSSLSSLSSDSTSSSSGDVIYGSGFTSYPEFNVPFYYIGMVFGYPQYSNHDLMHPTPSGNIVYVGGRYNVAIGATLYYQKIANFTDPTGAYERISDLVVEGSVSQ
jgi:hypothetical protein